MKKKTITYNKTEESVYTLFSLFILIKQNLQAITQNEDILDSDFDSEHNTFNDLVNDTIHEALRYQILLKTCSFLDEWNGVFGVKTESGDAEAIRVIKILSKPAIKCINSWKELREFRNQAIAHNHRDKAGSNIYLNPRPYHSPNTDAEIYLLIYCLKITIHVVDYFFRDVLVKVLDDYPRKQKVAHKKPMSYTAIKKKIKEIEDLVSLDLTQHHLMNSRP